MKTASTDASAPAAQTAATSAETQADKASDTSRFLREEEIRLFKITGRGNSSGRFQKGRGG
jgi:hypothetical protein